MNEKKEIKPSQFIEEYCNNRPADWSDPCGAIGCECSENKKEIEGIIKYLDSLYE